MPEIVIPPRFASDDTDGDAVGRLDWPTEASGWVEPDRPVAAGASRRTAKGGAGGLQPRGPGEPA